MLFQRRIHKLLNFDYLSLILRVFFTFLILVIASFGCIIFLVKFIHIFCVFYSMYVQVYYNLWPSGSVCAV